MEIQQLDRKSEKKLNFNILHDYVKQSNLNIETKHVFPAGVVHSSLRQKQRVTRAATRLYKKA